MAIKVVAYGAGGLVERDSLDDVQAFIGGGARVWIDVEGDEPIAPFLRDTLKIHPLAVEDILADRPSPKIEDYGEYLYVVVHGVVRGGEDPEALGLVELDLVLKERLLMTHHREPSRSVDAARDELSRNPRLLERGPAWVMHAILDHLVDYYLPVTDAFDEDVDQVETAVVENPTRQVLQRIFRLKRSLQRLRRIAIHQREVLHRLSRGEFDQIPEALAPFFRDVFDHFVRVADLADGHRDALSGALDAYLSVVSNRMNEVMKTLTVIATIFLPLTFIVGIYGMNFEHMPELKWQWGYLAVWIAMAAVAVGMIFWFRRRRWI